MKREEQVLLGLLGIAAVLWLSVALPLALGRRTLFFRDVFSNHLPLKAFGAAQLQEGRVPALNPRWALGQPFRGNPSALAFYPDNLLYLLLPFWSAFNLHFVLHWLLAAIGMWLLARQLAQSRAAALLAALTYAGSGWFVSTLTFYNLITVAAWWPWVMAAGARGGRRALALGGVACGLALLGGEPMTALLGMVPLALLTIWRHGWRRGLGAALAIGGAGLMVALPQLVATARILPFTFRAGHGTLVSQAVSYTLHPLRYLELLLPFPFGRFGVIGAEGFWMWSVAPEIPYFFTLYAGVVGLWLAAVALPRRRRWAALAVAGLLLAWLAGISGEVLVRLSLGIFRFPEKLTFWYALSLPLLAGWGLDRLPGRRRWLWLALGTGVVALGLALVAWWGHGGLVESLVSSSEVAPGWARERRLLETQMHLGIEALAVLGLLLVAAAWAGARNARGVLVGLQLLALLQLAPLLLTDTTRAYRAPTPWLQAVGPEGAVFDSSRAFPTWHATPDYHVGEGTQARFRRIAARNADAAPGALFGLSYPLAPDLEGLSSPLMTLLLANLPRLDWPARARWFRVVGLDAVVLYQNPGVAELETWKKARRGGISTWLLRVVGPAPSAWWPEEVVQVANPVEALKWVNRSEDPVAAVAIPDAVAHAPGGRVELLEAGPDRLVLRAEGGGGVVAVRRAYQPLFRASSSQGPLATFPLNLVLMGVEVPPGRHTVYLEVTGWPEAVAAGLSAVTLLAAVALSLGRWPLS